MHTIVVDLGYGDAGKGSIVDWLCRQATRAGRSGTATVVRFNGGAQAAHNVVTDDGRHHTFAQFGSGTFVPGVRTHLSRFMVVEPLALATEAEHLRTVGVPDALDRLSVSGDALVTTPFHRAANQARERARGAGRHGSCGVGVGETVRLALDDPAAALRVADLADPRQLRVILRAVRDALVDELGDDMLAGVPPLDAIAETFGCFAGAVTVVDDAALREHARRGPLVFEGAQGVLLDEWRGFHPYTTWSTTTFDNACTLADELGLGDVHRLGVTRAYQTRHGAGPFVTEDPSLDGVLPERHNGTGAWQGRFRVGHLDLVALRYAIEVCDGIDSLALTHLDRAESDVDLRVATAYRLAAYGARPAATLDRLEPGPFTDLDHQSRLTATLRQATPVLRTPDAPWSDLVERATGVPVSVESRGPAAGAKRARRATGRGAAGLWPRRPVRGGLIGPPQDLPTTPYLSDLPLRHPDHHAPARVRRRQMQIEGGPTCPRARKIFRAR
jgi:adenylosuccinate synthase